MNTIMKNGRTGMSARVNSHEDENGISIDQLRLIAPSIFAEQKHPDRSERFAVLPTIHAVEPLIKEGWIITQVIENKVRKEDKNGFQKHLIRFRHSERQTLFDGVDYNMVMVNAQDGTAALALFCAVIRYLCTNRVIIKDSEIASEKLRHSGRKDSDDVVNAAYRIIERAPMVAEAIRHMSTVQMSEPEKIAYARQALQIRWENELTRDAETGEVIKVMHTAPITPEILIDPRRDADNKNDLWSVFNVVQEHLIKGGDGGLNRSNKTTTTRAVNSATEQTRINKMLWEFTSEVAKTK